METPTVEQLAEATAYAIRNVGYLRIEQRLDFGETDELVQELAPYIAKSLREGAAE
jgi:hypothetical protein